ncbi:unnamed protein product, partial [Owenia fusiformis]
MESEGKQQGEYQCSVCDAEFYYMSHLLRHTRRHTGEQPFGCMTCGRRFSQVASLRRHWKVHTGERPHQCPYCLKTFSELSNMKRHQKLHKEYPVEGSLSETEGVRLYQNGPVNLNSTPWVKRTKYRRFQYTMLPVGKRFYPDIMAQHHSYITYRTPNHEPNQPNMNLYPGWERPKWAERIPRLQMPTDSQLISKHWNISDIHRFNQGDISMLENRQSHETTWCSKLSYCQCFTCKIKRKMIHDNTLEGGPSKIVPYVAKHTVPRPLSIYNGPVQGNIQFNKIITSNKSLIYNEQTEPLDLSMKCTA